MLKHLHRHGWACLILLTQMMAQAQATHPFPAAEHAGLWLLAGQSNMLGSASMPDKLEPPDPRLMLFNMDNTWIVAQDPLHRIFEAEAPIIAQFRYNDGVSKERYQQLRAESKQRPLGGVGPGMSFGRSIVEELDLPLGLIANSPGGSSMAHWSPDLKDKGDDSLYGAMLNRARMVGSDIKGIVWYQGEGETMDGDADQRYDKTLEKLITSLRADLNKPELPFLMVQVSRWTKANAPELDRKWERVRDVQYQTAQRIPHVYLTSAIDLTLTDEIHIDFAAQRRLGKRLGEIALSRVYNRPGHGRPLSVRKVEFTNREEKQNIITVDFAGVTGRLKADGRPTGFSVRVPDESPSPDVYKVEFDPAHPDRVILRLGAVKKGKKLQLLYGAGANPYVNITDERDMPVPGFGPIEVVVPE